MHNTTTSFYMGLTKELPCFALVYIRNLNLQLLAAKELPR